MEIANLFTAGEHGGPLTDLKRCSKGLELQNGSTGDFLGIDDLLDFFNDDVGGPIGEDDNACSSANTDVQPISFKDPPDEKCMQKPDIFVGGNQPTNLCVPCDDLAELEWLSNFMEDSFSKELSTTFFSSSFNPCNPEESKFEVGKHQFESASPISVLESNAYSPKLACFGPEMAVPGRPRSKRLRTGLCIWNTSILSAANSSATIIESSGTSSITTNGFQSLDVDMLAGEQRIDRLLHGKKVKHSQTRVKKSVDATQTRRCLHCDSQKTPQWRTGPMGPKTLCNACGVRYKSGRLLPEYRPAASPTFVEFIHSNSHKKVMEIRKYREGRHQGEEPFMWQQQQVELRYGNDEHLVDKRLEGGKISIFGEY